MYFDIPEITLKPAWFCIFENAMKYEHIHPVNKLDKIEGAERCTDCQG